MGTLIFALFIVLLVTGVPIAVAIGLSAVGAITFTGQYSLLAITHRMIAGVDSYVLLAIPFFILAGNIMNSTGVTSRIFGFAYALVGRIPGGMGHADIAASMIVSGMSGSAVADASGLGKVIFKVMPDKGFDMKFCAALQAAAATVGPIIPPSIPFVVFGSMADVSVGKLFVGGFLPGAVMGVTLMVLVYIISVRRGYPRDEKRFSIVRVLVSFKHAFLPLMAPIIIIGGIFAGLCTPTEAAVIATIYALFLGLVYRTLTVKALVSDLLNAGIATSVLVFIIAISTAFSWLIAMEGIPKATTEFILSITTSPFWIILLLNVILLIMGMFMESLSILTIAVPFMMPLIKAIGLDPVYVGVMVVLNLSIGLVTPPFGMCLFVCGKISNVPLGVLYKEIIPFLIPLIISLILISAFPEITLMLPRMVFG